MAKLYSFMCYVICYIWEEKKKKKTHKIIYIRAYMNISLVFLPIGPTEIFWTWKAAIYQIERSKKKKNIIRQIATSFNGSNGMDREYVYTYTWENRNFWSAFQIGLMPYIGEYHVNCRRTNRISFLFLSFLFSNHDVIFFGDAAP